MTSLFDELAEYYEENWYKAIYPRKYDSTATIALREAALAYYAALNVRLSPDLFLQCQSIACTDPGFAFYFARDILHANMTVCVEATNPDRFSGWKAKLAKINSDRLRVLYETER